MNTSPLKVREIEALTFIFRAPGAVTHGEINHRSGFLKRVWLRLLKGTQRPSASNSAADWTYPGL